MKHFSKFIAFFCNKPKQKRADVSKSAVLSWSLALSTILVSILFSLSFSSSVFVQRSVVERTTSTAYRRSGSQPILCLCEPNTSVASDGFSLNLEKANSLYKSDSNSISMVLPVDSSGAYLGGSLFVLSGVSNLSISFSAYSVSQKSDDSFLTTFPSTGYPSSPDFTKLGSDESPIAIPDRVADEIIESDSADGISSYSDLIQKKISLISSGVSEVRSGVILQIINCDGFKNGGTTRSKISPNQKLQKLCDYLGNFYITIASASAFSFKTRLLCLQASDRDVSRWIGETVCGDGLSSSWKVDLYSYSGAVYSEIPYSQEIPSLFCKEAQIYYGINGISLVLFLFFLSFYISLARSVVRSWRNKTGSLVAIYPEVLYFLIMAIVFILFPVDYSVFLSCFNVFGGLFLVVAIIFYFIKYCHSIHSTKIGHEISRFLVEKFY